MRPRPKASAPPPWRGGVDVRRQSKGPRYTRCPICKRQVRARAGRTATDYQVQFGLAVALAEHKRSEHPETKDD